MDILALLGGTPVRTRPFSSWPIFGDEEEARLLRTLRSGHWGRLQGTEVAEFENRFAAMHGCKHGIAVVNGTVSLRTALLAAGIRAEDEVIVPPYTFISTASAVIEANAIPVFADIDLDTFNLDPEAVRAAITPRTKAVIPVHFGGQPADMEAIMTIAREAGLTVIEDAAHAHGATYRQRPAGSLGHLASFSFQSSKNLTAGEGGIVTTNDDALAEACRSIQNCGRAADGLWYEHHVIAGNYRLGEFQGAVLNCQLDRLQEQTRDARFATAGISRHVSARCPDFIRRPVTPTAHGTAITSSCCGSTPIDLARRAKLCCARSRPREFPAPAATAARFTTSRCSATRRLDLSSPTPRHASTIASPVVRRATCSAASRPSGSNRRLFLGSRADIDDIASAFEKVHEHRRLLSGVDARC